MQLEKPSRGGQAGLGPGVSKSSWGEVGPMDGVKNK